MADQIGIKAKLHLSRTELDKEIANFKKELKDIQIKIDVDPSSLNGLKELQKIINDIYAKTKETIKIKTDFVPKDGKKPADDMYGFSSKLANNAPDDISGGMTAQAFNARYELIRRSLDKEAKLITRYNADNTKLLSATITYADNVGNTVMDSFKNIKGTNLIKLDSTTFTKDSIKIEKSLDGLNKGFVALDAKLKSLQNWGFDDTADDFTSALASMKTQIELLNGVGTNANPQTITDIQNQINGYNQILDIKKQDIDLDKAKEATQVKLYKLTQQLQDMLASGYVGGQFDSASVESFNQAIANLGANGGLDKMNADAYDLQKQLNTLIIGGKQVSKEMEAAGRSSHGLKRVSETLAKFGLYFSSWQLTRTLFSEISRGVGTIMELDNAIVQVGIDMNITTDEATRLRREAQKMAAETGIAIEQIVEVAGVYSNATENMTSVLAKVKPSAILAAVANTGAKEITDMFQGVINQYELAGEDVEDISYQISDTVIAVAKNLANNFDDSVTSISDAMLKSGSVMNDMGYTYQETAAIMGTLIERTRQTGDVIGNAMKTISARIGGAKTDEVIDPDDVSKASKAYESIGIHIVNADGSFKDMKDTLAELSTQWQTMTDVEKSYIAEASAGNRQRNIFMNMMDGMKKSTDLFNIAINSEGETLKTSEKYLESSRAKMEQFKAATDTLWQNSISADFVKGFIDFGTSVVGVVDKIGGLNIGLTLLTALLLNTNKAIKMQVITNQLLDMITGKVTVKALMMGNVIQGVGIKSLFATAGIHALQFALSLGLAAAITGAIMLFSKLIDSLIVTKKETEELNESLNTNIENIGNQVKSVEDLLDKQVELNAKLNQTTDEADRVKIQEELAGVYRDIADILPETVTEYDDNNNGLSKNVELIREQLQLKKEAMKLDAQSWLLNNKITNPNEYIANANKETQAMIDKLKELKKIASENGAVFEETYTETNDDGSSVELKRTRDINKEIAELVAKGVKNNETNAEIYEKMKLAGIDIAGNAEFINFTMADTTKNAKELGNATSGIKDDMGYIAKSAEDLMKSIQDSTQVIEDLQGILDELADEDSGLSTDSMNYMIEKYPQLIQYIGNEVELKKQIIALQDEESVSIQQNSAAKLMALSNEEKAAFRTFNAKVMYDTEWYNTTVKNNAQLIDQFNKAYGVDLRNYNSLAEAKNAVDQKYIGAAIKNYNQLYTGLNKANQQAVKAMTGNDAYDSLSIHDKAQLAKMNSSMASSTINAISFTPVGYSGVTRSSSSAGSSGSSSSSQRYESDLEGFSKSIEKIENYEKIIDNIDNAINKTASSLDNLVKIGSDEALQQALIEQSKLVDLQKEKFNALAASINELSKLKNSAASQILSNYGIDISQMTDEDRGRIADKLFPQISSTNQAIIDAYEARKETFLSLWDDYMNYADSVVSMEEQIISTESDMIDAIQSRYDTEFELLDNHLEEQAKLMEDYQDRIALLGSGSFNEQEGLLSSQLEATKSYRDSIVATIDDLENHLSTLEVGSAEWTIVNEKAEEYRDTLQEANESVLDTTQALKDLRTEEFNASMGLLDDIVAVLRTRYEEAKQAELDMVDKATEAEIATKREEISYLEERIAALRDDRVDKEAEVVALKKELEMWRSDDSVYAKSRVAELEKIVAEKEKDLAIDSMEKQISNIEKEVTAIEESAEDRKKTITTTYDELLKDENLYQQAVLIMTSSTQDQILQMMLENEPKYRSMGSILGAAFASGMMDEIEYGLSAYSGLLDGMNGDNSLLTWYDGLMASSANLGVYGTAGLTMGSTTLGGTITPTTDNLISGSASTLLQQLAQNNLMLTLDEPLVNIVATINNFSGGDATSQLAELQRILSGALPGSGVMLNLTTN